MILTSLKASLALLIVLSLSSCGAPKARQAWQEQAESFVKGYLDLHPEVAVKKGFHSYDGQVTDHSKEGIERRLAFFDRMQAGLIHVDLSSLNSEQRFEYRFIMQVIDAHIWSLRNAENWRYNVVTYEPSLDPSAYVEHNYADKAHRFNALEMHLQQMPKVLKQMRLQMKAPLGKTYKKIALAQMKGLKSYLTRKPQRVFRAEINASATFNKALKAAISEILKTHQWLDAMPDDTLDHRLGPMGIKSMLLAKEGITADIDKLRERGQYDLDENLAKLRAVCADYASGLSITNCIKRSKASKPYPNAVAALRRDIPRLRNFIERAGLINMPPMAAVEVKQTPNHRRRYQAFLETTGSGPDSSAIFYVSLPDPTWPEKKRFNYIQSRSDLIIDAAHEVWPGHYLHDQIASTSVSDVAKIFDGYALREGWATYAEELILDYGYENDDPELRIAQLTKALTRDVRLLAAIDMHTNNLPVDKAAIMFEHYAYLSPTYALKEAQRGIYDPEYLNYTLGKMYIKKLRHEWSNPLGGQRAWPEFHEALLQFGSPPLGLVEQLLFQWDSAPR